MITFFVFLALAVFISFMTYLSLRACLIAFKYCKNNIQQINESKSPRIEHYFEVDLILEDWIESSTNKSVYHTPKGVELCMGKFHSGTTFKAKVLMNSSDASELIEAKKQGFEPVFIVSIK